MYSTDAQGRYPVALTKLSDNQKYLRTIPTCASAGADKYTAAYSAGSNPDRYTVYCSGDNHAAVEAGANYPQYNSVAGLLEKK